MWIIRIKAAANLHDLSYSRFMDGLNKSGIQLNRKMLADLAVRDPEGFKNIAMTAKNALESA